MSAFLAGLLGWANPAHVAPLLAPGLAPSTAKSLLSAERLRPRVDAWLNELLGETDLAALDAIDARILDGLAADGNAALRLATLAGAVWHAPAVLGMVMAADIAAFSEKHGEAARKVAIAYAAMRPTIKTAGDVEKLQSDGEASVAAWIQSLPPSIAARVRLGWSDSEFPAPDAAHEAHGPAVVRLVAAEFAP